MDCELLLVVRRLLSIRKRLAALEKRRDQLSISLSDLNHSPREPGI